MSDAISDALDKIRAAADQPAWEKIICEFRETQDWQRREGLVRRAPELEGTPRAAFVLKWFAKNDREWRVRAAVPQALFGVEGGGALDFLMKMTETDPHPAPAKACVETMRAASREPLVASALTPGRVEGPTAGRPAVIVPSDQPAGRREPLVVSALMPGRVEGPTDVRPVYAVRSDRPARGLAFIMPSDQRAVGPSAVRSVPALTDRATQGPGIERDGIDEPRHEALALPPEKIRDWLRALQTDHPDPQVREAARL